MKTVKAASEALTWSMSLGTAMASPGAYGVSPHRAMLNFPVPAAPPPPPLPPDPPPPQPASVTASAPTTAHLRHTPMAEACHDDGGSEPELQGLPADDHVDRAVRRRHRSRREVVQLERGW